MKHLITGGAGFIGSHLADALVARGDELLILDDLSTGSKENLAHLLSNGRVELVEGSVLDHLLVDDLMQEADACFHLASAVGVSLIVERPLETLLQNVRGADVVTATAAQRESRLVFTSTSEIYGKNSHGGLSENADRVLGSPSTSRWTYATAKSLGEMLAYGYHRERAAETVVVRLFNTVGPRQTGAYGMVLPRFVRQALAGEELTVYGDGTQSRCFIHVHDAVDALQHVAGSDEALGNAYNIGCPNEITILGLAEKVIERAGSSSGVRFVPFAEAYGGGFEELGRRKADTSALERLTGWRPRRTIDDAIDDTIAYQQQLLARELVA